MNQIPFPTNPNTAGQAAENAAAETKRLAENTEHGLAKCPKCGSAEIVPHNGKLFCLYCRYSFDSVTSQLHTDQGIEELNTHIIGPGAACIKRDDNQTVTIKCQGCGAEVVIHTEEALQSRCHWCRQTLSINSQIPNGAVPDLILPFQVTKAQAVENIRRFVNARTRWTDKEFLAQFTPDNTLGVYLPYMIVDVNCRTEYHGVGQQVVRTYQVSKDEETRYDVNQYSIGRAVDLYVNDLPIESRKEFDSYGMQSGQATRSFSTRDNDSVNVINAVQPFDTENAVAYNANYLRGYASEKRDQDVSELQDLADWQLLSIGREKIIRSTTNYDGGVRWQAEGVKIRGSRWLAMYLPVWLFSYVQIKNQRLTNRPIEFKHYIAVNARTGETMGSLPVNYRNVNLGALLATIISLIVGLFSTSLYVLTSGKEDFSLFFWVIILAFAIGFFTRYSLIRKVRNFDVSHNFEAETSIKIGQLTGYDQFLASYTNVDEDTIEGDNHDAPRERVQRLHPDSLKL